MVSQNKDLMPELSNFEGFQDDEFIEVQADQGRIYEDHLPFEELALGVKEGRFFQGRFNVSRLVPGEAIDKVAGLN